MNVIFHLNQFERMDHCYANVKNLLKETVGEIHILINGEPVSLAVSGQENRLEELIDLGVTISLCNNALKANNIDKEHLISGVNIVSAGVLELMEKQEAGFSYIKP